MTACTPPATVSRAAHQSPRAASAAGSAVGSSDVLGADGDPVGSEACAVELAAVGESGVPSSDPQAVRPTGRSTSALSAVAMREAATRISKASAAVERTLGVASHPLEGAPQ